MFSMQIAVFAVNLAIYGAYFCGVFLLSMDSVTAFTRSLSLRRGLGKENSGRFSKFAPVAYVNKILFTIFQKEVDGAAFLLAACLLFAAVFLFGLKLFLPVTAFLAAVMAAALPVMIVFVKLESERTKGSREGISFVTELHRQYRMHNKNIYEAMEAVSSAPGDFPVCKRHLYRLLLRLRGCGSAEEMKEYTDQFSFALGTVWGHMLAVCIRMAARSGTDITAGLADIAEQLKAANARAEERRRLNSESLRMTLFLVPMLYIGTLLLAVMYLDVGLTDLLKNQFATPEGLLFFLFIAFLTVLNMVILRAVSNVRIDY